MLQQKLGQLNESIYTRNWQFACYVRDPLSIKTKYNIIKLIFNDYIY